MKKNLVFSLLIAYCLLRIASTVHADYVLPYPSYMPGSSMYRVSRITDRIKSYWSWGNIAQVKYHLSLSDKYLIEAKTLMEYKQFLLAADALLRSDTEFSQLPLYVDGVKKEGADIRGLQRIITQAADKHAEVLAGLLSVTPDQFRWTPEKSSPTDLALGLMLKTSVDVRQKIASETGSL